MGARRHGRRGSRRTANLVALYGTGAGGFERAACQHASTTSFEGISASSSSVSPHVSARLERRPSRTFSSYLAFLSSLSSFSFFSFFRSSKRSSSRARFDVPSFAAPRYARESSRSSRIATSSSSGRP
jgi:hypothetical protein